MLGRRPLVLFVAISVLLVYAVRAVPIGGTSVEVLQPFSPNFFVKLGAKDAGEPAAVESSSAVPSSPTDEKLLVDAKEAVEDASAADVAQDEKVEGEKVTENTAAQGEGKPEKVVENAPAKEQETLTSAGADAATSTATDTTDMPVTAADASVSSQPVSQKTAASEPATAVVEDAKPAAEGDAAVITTTTTVDEGAEAADATASTETTASPTDGEVEGASKEGHATSQETGETERQGPADGAAAAASMSKEADSGEDAAATADASKEADSVEVAATTVDASKETDSSAAAKVEADQTSEEENLIGVDPRRSKGVAPKLSAAVVEDEEPSVVGLM